jgi:hypothetical protein
MLSVLLSGVQSSKKQEVSMANRPRLLGLLLPFLGVLAACASTPGSGWELVAERVVNDRAERDEIVLPPGRGPFEALQIQVRRSSVRIYDMKVHFRNGSVQDVDLRDVIPAGGRSRVIDLRGDERRIERVTFRYEAASPGRRRAVIQLFGRR